MADAVRVAAARPLPVTQVRTAAARVEQVGSNRRIVGVDGKIKGVRWTRCRDAELRAEPEGTIDPFLRSIVFVSGDHPVAALHTYAVHPTSHDGTGRVTCAFVGLSRDRVEAEQGFPQIYFTGCAGNVTTGKYTDGAGDYRETFTERIATAMRSTCATAEPVNAGFVEWRTVPVFLSPCDTVSEQDLLDVVSDPGAEPKARSRAALMLAYRRRCERGIPLLLGALHLGPDLVWLSTPGETFVEYQLDAQRLRPKTSLVTVSYGDCGPGYVPLARSFAEGGYEPTDAFCSAQCEAPMRTAIARLVARRPDH